MIKHLLTFIISATFLTGCGVFSKKTQDYDYEVANTGRKQKKKNAHLVALKSGAYSTPCINLPFIDKHYPEDLGEVIRIYNPKVDPVGAYKISRKIVKEEKKESTHVIDTKSVKLCKVGGEMGFLFKAIAVKK
jgi:PBP1b-binding outer membrane lipoprotein LpoB